LPEQIQIDKFQEIPVPLARLIDTSNKIRGGSA